MFTGQMTAEELFEFDKTEVHKTEHYLFYYQKGSLAEQDIRTIAQTQENAFSKICGTLNVLYPEPIRYYFTDSPQAIGWAVWNDDFPCNGVALCGKSKIYAVYSKNIKCVGSHEDTHLIAWHINYPESDFVCEGLAMFFDGIWWSVPNEVWASYYKRKYPQLSIQAMFHNNTFEKIGCVIAYPIAGAFTRFLIERFSLNKYLEFYKYKGNDYNQAVFPCFGVSLEELEAIFWKQMKAIAFDATVLEKLLKEEGF